MDPARQLLARFAQLFTVGMDDRAAFDQTIADLPNQYHEVANRSLQQGLLPPIEVGEEFRYRNQIRLAGLHNDRIRGICHHNGIATCVVVKYPLHNFEAQGAEVVGLIVGGEGGLLRDAHRHGMRVLEHQRLSAGNASMFNARWERTSVRVVAFGEIQEGGNNVGNNNTGYFFLGLYTVLDGHLIVTEDGFQVYEYFLHPLPLAAMPPIPLPLAAMPPIPLQIEDA